MTTLYLSDTLVSGVRYALLGTPGTAATLGSGNEGGSVFLEKLRFEREVGLNGINGTSFPTSIDMASVSASTLEWRWRVVKVDSSGAITAGSAYSTAQNTAGIKTATLTLSTTWAAGDRVGISIELRKTGGGGNRSFSVNVNDADSWVDAPMPAVVVTGSIAQNLPALTQSAVGAAEAAGAGVQSLPALSQAATGTVEVTGTSAQTLGALSQIASGSVTEDDTVSGSVAQTLPSLTQQASGSVEVQGTSVQTLPALTQEAQGSLQVEGSGTQTLPGLTQSASGEASLEGASAQTLPALTQSAQGTVGDVVNGIGAQTLPAFTQAASGIVAIAGDGASALGALTQAATGTLTTSGTATQLLPALQQLVSGSVVIEGAGVPVEGPTRVTIRTGSNRLAVGSANQVLIPSGSGSSMPRPSSNSVEVQD